MSRMYRVLCAYDESPSAERAFDYAVILAKRFEGELHVLNVVPPTETVKGDPAALLEAGKARLAATFARLQEKCDTVGIPAVLEVRLGYPAQVVLQYADELSVRHIVTGRRGISAMQRASLGSVSQRIVLHATCLATVVP